MKGLLFFFLLISIHLGATGQVKDEYHFEKLHDKDIDSLVADSLVRNEFKILNYCYCQYYLENERIKLENVWRKKKLQLRTVPHLGYLGGGHEFSFYKYERGKSFFRWNNVDSLDFNELKVKYYLPIVEYLKSETDMQLLAGYSPMFECFYSVEKMPLKEELTRFLILNKQKLRFFIVD